MGKRKSSDISEKTKDRLNWTTEMDQVLLDSLLEEEEKGNRVDGCWTTIGLNNVAKACTEKFHIAVDKNKVINRRRTLKDNYKMCHNHFSGTIGFAWNPDTKLFDAEPDVWTEFIQRKPDAAKWRHTPICHYYKLEALFGKDRACGGAITAKEKMQQRTKEDQSNLNSQGSSCLPISSEKDLFPLALDSSKKLKKKVMAEMIGKQTEVFRSGFVALTEALKESNAILRETRVRVYAEEDVYRELIAIGVPMEHLVDSMIYLTKNPAEVRALFSVPSALRKEMLFKFMKN